MSVERNLRSGLGLLYSQNFFEFMCTGSETTGCDIQLPRYHRLGTMAKRGICLPGTQWSSVSTETPLYQVRLAQ